MDAMWVHRMLSNLTTTARFQQKAYIFLFRNPALCVPGHFTINKLAMATHQMKYVWLLYSLEPILNALTCSMVIACSQIILGSALRAVVLVCGMVALIFGEYLITANILL